MTNRLSGGRYVCILPALKKRRRIKLRYLFSYTFLSKKPKGRALPAGSAWPAVRALSTKMSKRLSFASPFVQSGAAVAAAA